MKDKLTLDTRGKLASKYARPGIVHRNQVLRHCRGRLQRLPPRCSELRRYLVFMATAFGDYKVPKSQYHCAYELHVSWMEAARSCPHPAAWPLDVVFNKRLNTVQETPSSHSLSGPSRFIVRHMESNSRKSLNMTTFRGNLNYSTQIFPEMS